MPRTSAASELSWSRLNALRKTIRARWRRIHALPRIPRAARRAAASIEPGAAVLDVGASSGGFGSKLPPGCVYRTLDVDPEVAADYRSIDEAPDAWADAVVSFETLEHLSLPDARALLSGVVRVLKPGGRLFLTTPNVHHPWSYLRSCTHVTPFCYDELGALVLEAGLEVEGMFRCHRDSFFKSVARLLAVPLYRVTGMDYAKSILVVGRRPEK